MLTEVITRAFEACDQKIVWGFAGERWVDSAGTQRAWEFNAALGNVAGMLALGLVVNKPGMEDATLQVHAGGTAPGIRGKHYAFATDCSPRASLDVMFVVQDPVPDEVHEETCQSWVDE